MKLYHISSIPNIEVLQPKKSTHGVPYIYATFNLHLGLLFGSSKSHGDFDGMYGVVIFMKLILQHFNQKKHRFVQKL